VRPLGIKSVTVVGLLILTVGIALHSDRFHPTYLINLTAESSFVLGLFTILIGTWFNGLFGLGKLSRSYFRFSSGNTILEKEVVLIGGIKFALVVGQEPSITPVELSPSLMRIFSFLICFSIALTCFSTYTAALIFEAPRRFAQNSHICPVAEKSSKGRDHLDPEGASCELVYRALKLGYIKDLGTCGVINNEKIELCTLRQFDEPLLHYSSRLFFQFVTHARSEWKDLVFWHRMLNVFNMQMTHIKSILEKMTYVVGNSPRASHHIFTNLPNPNTPLKEFVDHWFRPNKCLTEDLKVADDSSSMSSAFEHVYKEILFNPSYAEAAGFCKEYKIHWNSPIESCEKLAHAPEEFLRSMGIAEQIKTVINRFLGQTNMAVLKLQIKSIITGMPIPPPPPPEAGTKAQPFVTSITSFQCFMKVDKVQDAKLSKRPFQLFGYDYVARDLRFSDNSGPEKIHIDLYKYFAQAMAEGETYSSETQWHVDPEIFGSGSYPLTRLEYLKYIDLFFGSQWLQSRQDLLEVYPYYYHFQRFIELFRQDYRSQRTRL